MNIMNIRRIEGHKPYVADSWHNILSLLLECDTGNNTYSDCNCSDDILDNYYVIIVL